MVLKTMDCRIVMLIKTSNLLLAMNMPKALLMSSRMQRMERCIHFVSMTSVSSDEKCLPAPTCLVFCSQSSAIFCCQRHETSCMIISSSRAYCYPTVSRRRRNGHAPSLTFPPLPAHASEHSTFSPPPREAGPSDIHLHTYNSSIDAAQYEAHQQQYPGKR